MDYQLLDATEARLGRCGEGVRVCLRQHSEQLGELAGVQGADAKNHAGGEKEGIFRLSQEEPSGLRARAGGGIVPKAVFEADGQGHASRAGRRDQVWEDDIRAVVLRRSGELFNLEQFSGDGARLTPFRRRETHGNTF